MKITKRLLVMTLALALVLALAIIPAVAAEPVTLSGNVTMTLEDLNSGSFIVKAGDYAVITVEDATSIQATVSADNAGLGLGYGKVIGEAGAATIISDSADGAQIILLATDCAEDVKVTIVAESIYGTLTDPEVAPYYAGADCWLMNTNVRADGDRYIWLHTATADGLLYIESSSVDAYVVELSNQTTYESASSLNGNACFIPVSKGDEVLIAVAAQNIGTFLEPNYPAIFVNVAAFMSNGTIEEPIPVKRFAAVDTDYDGVNDAEQYGVRVPAGKTVYLVDGSKDAFLCENPLTVAGSWGVDMSKVVVTVYNNDGTVAGTYTDVDGDGKVELTLGGGYYSRPIIAITNKDEYSADYILSQDHSCEMQHVQAVKPGVHTAGMKEHWYCADCDVYYDDEAGKLVTNRLNLVIPAEKPLSYYAATEPNCHQAGNAEYWYCGDEACCGAVYADAEGTQLTNRKNLTIPALKALTHVEAVEVACHQNGSAEYWYCEECDAVFADAAGTQLTNRKNLTIAAPALIHVAAVEATCHQNGSAEYWYCATCDAVFADAAGTQLTNRKNLTIAAPALAYVPAAEACHKPGCAEYWQCTTCDAVFADAAGTILTNRKNLETEPDCTLAYVPAAPACHVPGIAEYWYCPECEAVYADEAGTILTNRKNLEIAPVCTLTYVAPTGGCHTDGMAEYWYCEICDAVYADEAGTQLTNRKNLTIAGGSALTYVPATEACHKPGCAEYWYCVTCEAVYADAEGTILTNRKNLEIEPDCALVYVPAAPACHVPGIAEYWYCPECEAVYADEAGTELTNRKNLEIAPTCTLTHVAAVAATCTENGSAEYWYCAECEAVYADEAGTQLTNRKNLTIEATGHNYDENGKCVCGDTADDSPNTGDYAVVMFIIAAASVMALVVVLGKKRYC